MQRDIKVTGDLIALTGSRVTQDADLHEMLRAYLHLGPDEQVIKHVKDHTTGEWTVTVDKKP